jgi:hypothetical protein
MTRVWQETTEQETAKGRAYERRSCRLLGRCRRFKGHGIYAADETYTEVRLLNQSKGGLLLESPIYFPEGCRLEVVFNSPDNRQSFMEVVTVRWQRRVGERFYLGVKTDEIERL